MNLDRCRTEASGVRLRHDPDHAGDLTEGATRAMKPSGLLAVLLSAIVGVVAVAPSAVAAERRGTRDVLVVSNNWAGSADLVDPHTFRRLKRINVIPDRRARVAEIKADTTATFYF